MAAKDAKQYQDPLVYIPGQVYLKDPFGANLVLGLHYEFFPGARLLGGFMISAARASRLTEAEALSANSNSVSGTFSRGFIPYAEYEHPWTQSFKTKADVSLNPSDSAFIAQWGLRLILGMAGFEAQGEFDNVKTLGGNQTMVGIRGTKEYAASEGAANKAIVRAGRISRTTDNLLTLPEVQSLKTGNYIIGELWHNWLVAGLSYVENVGAGARLGFGKEFGKNKAVASLQYKYLMSDIYGARVDDFSLYLSMLAKDIF